METQALQLDSSAVLNALPYFAMVMDGRHRVIQANTRFIAEAEADPGECPISCYPVVHKSSGPHKDCPLRECARTGKPVERVIDDEHLGKLLVQVYPLGAVAGTKRKLFLHFARPA